MVITGNGKGKTTSAWGQAVRAIGHGFRVCMIQFMKGGACGEVAAAQKYLPIEVRHFGLDHFVKRNNPSALDKELAQQGLTTAKTIIDSGEYDMVILDEINLVLDFRLVALEEVLEMVKNKPPELHLIMTGRNAPAALIELADTVSEIIEVKHHHTVGIKSHQGIEY